MGAVVVFTCVAIGLLMKGKEVSVPGMAAMAVSAWDSFETTAAQNYVHFSDLFWGRTYVSDIVYTWLSCVAFPWKPERYGAVLIFFFLTMWAPRIVLFLVEVLAISGTWASSLSPWVWRSCPRHSTFVCLTGSNGLAVSSHRQLPQCRLDGGGGKCCAFTGSSFSSLRNEKHEYGNCDLYRGATRPALS